MKFIVTCKPKGSKQINKVNVLVIADSREKALQAIEEQGMRIMSIRPVTGGTLTKQQVAYAGAQSAREFIDDVVNCFQKLNLLGLSDEALNMMFSISWHNMVKFLSFMDSLESQEISRPYMGDVDNEEFKELALLVRKEATPEDIKEIFTN